MNNFTFYAPTLFAFGKGEERNTGALVRRFGGTKVLLVYGGGSVKRNGAYDAVTTSLKEAGLPWVELSGIQPNPHVGLVREGIALCEKEGVDFLLPVGGGSTIDSAKAIGYGVACGGEVWDFYDFKRTPTACLPIGVVLTIAAAGSEMSDSSVITNEDGGIKRGCNNDLCRCKFAIMDPELTMTLPDYQTACGCADILMHTMERYFNVDEMALTDALAEGLMRTVIDAAKVLVKDPKNYEARANVMWASSLSHNGLTGCGAGKGDWACHRLEHELGGMFDVSHGAGLAAVWG
ncbi:MAG: iron-containing alcohol dehydrogenase, partial [Oscillospiraceae bacterium]|nr:iron-containing alcohol dehydrogenase [Oscillospiraceae bacterium]